MVDSTPSDYHLTYLRERWERDRSSRVFLQLAEEYRRRGLHAEALEVLQVGLTHHPGYLAAQVALGRTRMEAGHLDAATQVLEGVLRHDPTQAVAIRLLAESWLRLRNPAKAREAIDRCRLLGVPPAELQVFEERLRSLREEETLTPAFADDAPAPAMPADGALPADGQVEEDAAWAADASEAPTHVPTGWGGAPAVAERDLGEPAGSSASLPAEQEDAAIAPPAAATDDLPVAEEPAGAPETSGEPWPGFAAPVESPAVPAAAAFGDVIPLPRVAAPPVALPLHHGVARRLVRYAAEDPFPLVGATALSPAAAAIASADVFALAPPQPAVTPAAPPAAPRPWEAPAAPADAFAAADAVSAPAPATETAAEAAAETAAAEATPAEAGSAGATPADDLLAPPPLSAVAEGPAGPEAWSTPSPAVEEPPAPGITEAAEDAEPLPWDDTVAAAGPAVAQIEQEERAAWQEPHEAAAAWAVPGAATGDAGAPGLAGPPTEEWPEAPAAADWSRTAAEPPAPAVEAAAAEPWAAPEAPPWQPPPATEEDFAAATPPPQLPAPPAVEAAAPSPLAAQAVGEAGLTAGATAEQRPADAATATLGELYLQQGHLGEAERIFHQVLARDPDNEAALRGLEAIGERRGAALSASELLPGGEPEVRGVSARKILLLQRYLQTLRRGARRDVPGTAE